ncbi:MAG TPA: hypothetical protein VFT53_06605 [Candidatus Saccharimonadales bacterium]|nr:hypothetical protein [Candidatus Saccharimonadales bacterium]
MRLTFHKLNRTDIWLVVVMCLLLGAAIVAALIGRLNASVNSYDDCVRAGNPVQMTYPSVCVGAGGQRFVNPAEQAPGGPLPL